MGDIYKKLSKNKVSEIESFLKKRFNILDSIREEFDSDMQEEVDLYNNKDKHIEGKESWEEKQKIPYLYTVVQTVVARIIESLFGRDNFLRIYIEKKELKNLEKPVQQWFQSVLDRVKLKSRARDFIEDALVKRVSVLQAIPNVKNGKFSGADFDIHDFFNIWYDYKAKTASDTDFFVRKIKKHYKVLQQEGKHYYNTEKIKKSAPPEEIAEQQEYESKHDTSKSVFYYDPDGISPTDEVELLEYYGIYNISENPEKPEWKECIFTLANRDILIRADEVTVPTQRKRFFFFVRPLKQASSLVGKSIPQLLKDLQYELNEVRSLRMSNFKTVIKLLFKFRREAGIEMNELFADGGNAIGYEDNPNDIDIFNVPDKISESTLIGREIIQDMQLVSGAVDPVMGTGGGKSNETASGIRTVTEQALFKFGMMANNVHDDLIEFLNYMIILEIQANRDSIILNSPELGEFIDQPLEDLESSYSIDIALNDLAMRRDVERSQFVNVANIILGVMQQTGGNIKAFLRQIMERFNVENIDEILQENVPDDSANQQMLQAMAQGGGTLANQNAPKESTPEEEALNENTERRRV